MAEEKKVDENKENVMDYAEHERTYKMFLEGSKLLTIIAVSLLIAMAFGFFAGGGFLGGLIVFVALCAISYIIL